MTNPKRMRKMALYLEWIAFNLRKDADDMEATRKSKKQKPHRPQWERTGELVDKEQAR